MFLGGLGLRSEGLQVNAKADTLVTPSEEPGAKGWGGLAEVNGNGHIEAEPPGDAGLV